MIVVGDVFVSDDVADKEFVCHLDKCKGACCVEGDMGAPLEEKELAEIDKVLSKVLPYLPERAREVITQKGAYVKDADNEFSTQTIDGRECVFAFYDKKGILGCGFEKACADGKIAFKKPISCHLYPIRITAYDRFEAVNYNRWHICRDACTLGKQLGVPLYKFLSEPLIRKYGSDWYSDLVRHIENK